jgi:tetratricopeptide (TPR) repeat protein
MDDVYARYREHLRLGHQEAAEGRFADALRHYEAAADVAADRALPHVLVGGMQLRLGRAKEALAAYELALTAEPANLDALSGRAAALLAAGRRDEAARVQRQILDMRAGGEPDASTAASASDGTPMTAADTMHAAGEQALRAGQHEAAIDAFLAESGEHAAAGRLDAALDASLGALAIAPGAARIHLELARLYFQRGWADKGVERALLLHRLLTLEPDDTVRQGLANLAAEHAATDERLASLAAPVNPTG